MLNCGVSCVILGTKVQVGMLWNGEVAVQQCQMSYSHLRLGCILPWKFCHLAKNLDQYITMGGPDEFATKCSCLRAIAFFVE